MQEYLKHTTISITTDTYTKENGLLVMMKSSLLLFFNLSKNVMRPGSLIKYSLIFLETIRCISGWMLLMAACEGGKRCESHYQNNQTHFLILNTGRSTIKELIIMVIYVPLMSWDCHFIHCITYHHLTHFFKFLNKNNKVQWIIYHIQTYRHLLLCPGIKTMTIIIPGRKVIEMNMGIIKVYSSIF